MKPLSMRERGVKDMAGKSVAVVGATGQVGGVVLRLLAERNFPVSSLRVMSSARSAGSGITWQGQEYVVEDAAIADLSGIDIAIFSAGGGTSRELAPKFASAGAIVIDNSSAWRMDPDVPLVVSEVNPEEVKNAKKGIIANPNCSTIQMVVALNDIYKQFGLKRLVISTYQSVTGTGHAAVKQMKDERQGLKAQKVYPYQIDQNCFPHGGDFLENGYTTEEMKLIDETRKIFNDSSIKITATVVRIPVIGGHSESINVETHKPFQIQEIIRTLILMN